MFFSLACDLAQSNDLMIMSWQLCGAETILRCHSDGKMMAIPACRDFMTSDGKNKLNTSLYRAHYRVKRIV